MKIIGLSGKVGSGKDTVQQLMQSEFENRGLKCMKLSFAKPLKDICALMFNWDRVRLDYDTSYKESNTLDNGDIDPVCEIFEGKTRRALLQEIGTECFRNGFDNDFWIKLSILAMKNGDYDDYDIGFLTDCRFLNELHFVRASGGKIFQIQRTGDSDTLTDRTEHTSETEWQKWLDWDSIIENIIDSRLSKEANMSVLASTVSRIIDNHNL